MGCPVTEEVPAIRNLKDVMMGSITRAFRKSKLIIRSRAALSDGVATSYVWLSRFKVLEMKQS